MKILILNALVVTMNAQSEVIEKGSVAIDGNKLVYVGPAEWTPSGPFDITIEGDRRIAMPGMVNAHCHSPANLVRGMIPSKPLEIWRAYYLNSTYLFELQGGFYSWLSSRPRRGSQLIRKAAKCELSQGGAAK